MRKIPRELENPIDNVIIDLCEASLGFYKALNFTPNILTTFSLAFGMLSVLLFHCDVRLGSAASFIVSYYFDCADGSYARSYGMVTKLGDIYDHVSDNLKLTLLFCIMAYRDCYRVLMFSPLILFFAFMTCLHLGCQEKVYGKDDGPSIRILTNMVYKDPKEIMRYSKYFSCGTSIFMMAFMIIIF